MMINPDRWLREVTVPLVAEELAALCGTQQFAQQEKRDSSGKWTSMGEVLAHHGYKKTGTPKKSKYSNSTEQEYAHKSGYKAVHVTTDKTPETPSGEVVRILKGPVGTIHVESKDLHKMLTKVHGGAKHTAEEIEALFNVVSAAASFTPGAKGGLPDPQVTMDGSAGTEDEVMSMDGRNQKRDKKGQFSGPGVAHVDAHKTLVKHGYKQTRHDTGMSGTTHSTYVRGPHMVTTNSQGYIRHSPSGKDWEGKQGAAGLDKHLTKVHGPGSIHSAANEIAMLMAGHDVSGENRQGGKFAPGAKAAEPTGSPLDPATGVKPPPAPHEIHKQNMDNHNKAAKACQSMVKQHLDLAKVALSQEDRQNHINQARDMKQLAAKHVTAAGEHAKKMSQAMQQMTQPQQPPMPGFHSEEQVEAQGLRKPNPQGSVQTPDNTQAWVDHAKKPGGRLDPNNQTQQMPAIVPPDTSTGEGSLPAASQQPGAQMQPKGTGGYQGKPGGPLQQKQARESAAQKAEKQASAYVKGSPAWTMHMKRAGMIRRGEAPLPGQQGGR